MDIRRSVIFFVLIMNAGIYAQTVPVVPNDRMVNWSVAGLLPGTSKTARCVFKVDNYQGTDDQKMAAALSAVRSYHQSNPNHLVIINFSARTYNFTKPINLRIQDNNTILQGYDSNWTRFNFASFHKDSCCFNLKGISDSYFDLQDNSVILKGSYNLYSKDTWNWSTNGFQAGSWIHFSEAYFDYGETGYETYKIGQITQLSQISGTLGIMKDAASKEYRDNNILKVCKINPVKNIGLEKFSIYRQASSRGAGDNIYFKFAVNCWVEGVESYNPVREHLVIEYSSHILVSGCDMHHAVDYGSDERYGYGYGVLLEGSVTNCLIENNIFSYLRHAMIVSAGANCNVFAMNFSRDQHWAEEFLGFGKGPDICIHGKYPYANLFEQNVVDRMHIDAAHYWNGPYNTLLRNRTNSTEKINNTWAFYSNIIGNDNTTHVDIVPFGMEDLDVYYNIYTSEAWTSYYPINHSNALTTQPTTPLCFLNDVSYYYSSKPAFCGSQYTWPTNGPATNLDRNSTLEPTCKKIPAQDRWNSSPKTYISDAATYTITTSGTVASNEIWSNPLNQSCITLTGSVTIPAGITLKVMPYTVVKAPSGCQIIVHGKIDVDGATFQSTGSGNWYGMIIDGSVVSLIKNCKFKEGTYGIVVGGASPGSAPDIRNCDIQATTAGVWIKDYGKPALTNSYIKSTGMAGILCTGNAAGYVTTSKIYGASTYGHKNENSAATSFAYCGSARNWFDKDFTKASICVTGGSPVYDQGRNCIDRKTSLIQYWNQTATTKYARYNYWGGEPPVISGSVTFIPDITTRPNPVGPSWTLTKTSDADLGEKYLDSLAIAWQVFYEGNYNTSGSMAKEIFDRDRNKEQGSAALFLWMKSSLERGTLEQDIKVFNSSLDGSIHEAVRYEGIRWQSKLAVSKGQYKKAEEMVLSIPAGSPYGRELLLDLGVEIMERIGDTEKAEKIFDKLVDKYNNETTRVEKDEILSLYRDYLCRVPVDVVVGKPGEMESVSAGLLDVPAPSAYPNPFNPETRIIYQVNEATRVQVAVYDILGRRVSMLVDGEQQSGVHTALWSGRDEHGLTLPSGVYICRVQTGVNVHTLKLLLAK